MKKLRFGTYLVLSFALLLSCRNETAPIEPTGISTSKPTQPVRASGIKRPEERLEQLRSDYTIRGEAADYVYISPWVNWVYGIPDGGGSGGIREYEKYKESGGSDPYPYNEVSGEGFGWFYYDRSLLSQYEAEEFATYASYFGTEDANCTDPATVIPAVKIKNRIIDTQCEKDAIKTFVLACKLADEEYKTNNSTCFQNVGISPALAIAVVNSAEFGKALNQALLKGQLHYATRARIVGLIGPVLVAYGVVLNTYVASCLDSSTNTLILKLAQAATDLNSKLSTCS